MAAPAVKDAGLAADMRRWEAIARGGYADNAHFDDPVDYDDTAVAEAAGAAAAAGPAAGGVVQEGPAAAAPAVAEEAAPAAAAGGGGVTAADIALWERMAQSDYAGVGCDIEPLGDLSDRPPGAWSKPGHNLYEHDIPVPAGEQPTPPRPDNPPEQSAQSRIGEGISDADYRKWKEAAMQGYPQPEDPVDDEPPAGAGAPRAGYAAPKGRF
eukprot:TRINITY_DN30013_c1_g1_i1.p2 TRINITY_DN30013_c1_g1~~TRINITY_DN30013_c1_g1_i1.p2  ORF type:complete len:234 (+),score=70.92 TRINITY_DN30013_c1_g1_i1:71-703(+)